MLQLDKKVCIVTGGARGIGKAVVKRFLQAGAIVTIADIDLETAERTRAEFSEIGEVDILHVDVADESSVNNLVEKVKTRHGSIDVLINNAGVQPPKQPLQEIEASTWDRTFNINVKGVFLCSKAVTPIFMEQKSGSIINTSSVAGGLFLWEGSLHYIATKGAVDALTKAMALELAPHNIRVNAVAPGHVDTELNTTLLSDAEARRAVEEPIPLRRVAQSDDLAGAYLFLASQRSAYITGHILYVDGGLTQIK